MAKRKALILGFVGLPGAGKTTASEYLVKKGFAHIILSDFIKEEAEKSGKSISSREDLQEWGNRMREQYGPQVLAQLAMKRIRDKGYNKAIIDGIRNLYEVAFLKVENGFSLIGVVARPKVRFERMKVRKGRALLGTYEDFLRHERREDSLGSRETGLRVKDCLKKADYTIENNGTFKVFNVSLNALVRLLPHLQKP